jgi:hypothetical protein
MRKHLFLIGTIVALVAAMIIVSGCSDDESITEPEGEAPALPPQSSFIMSFSNFDTSSMGAKWEPHSPQALTIQNWFFSAATVGAWNFVLTFTMAVPVASFVAAFGNSPVYEGEGWWVWSYDFTAGNVSHTADLKGRIVADSVEWEMYITRTGEYTDFNWYSGKHDLFATEGWWLLRYNPGNSEPWLQIDWERDTLNNVGELTYTIVESSAADFGGYINYGSTTGADYDCFFTIYDPSESRMTYIEWHHSDHDGRVKDNIRFGDDDWHCWDEQLQDIDCP